MNPDDGAIHQIKLGDWPFLLFDRQVPFYKRFLFLSAVLVTEVKWRE